MNQIVPRVTLCWLLKVSLMYLVSKQLLPTPESPMMMTLNWTSQSSFLRDLSLDLVGDFELESYMRLDLS